MRRRGGSGTLPRLSRVSVPPARDDHAPGISLEPATIEAHLSEAVAAIAAAASLEELKQVRLEHVADRSPLAGANRLIGSLAPSEKAAAGKLVGQARAQVGSALAARTAELEAARDERILIEEAIDLTAVPGARPLGRRHPLTLMCERMADVMVAMGWEIAEGPQIEAEWFNFDALNFDADHPARAMQDTFFVDPADAGLVLRTHTSPVQARCLLERGAPLYVAAPGKTFRTDELDATHTPVFHQMEGLAVDRGLTMAHLRGTLDRLAGSLFGDGIVTRLRPSFFPFTEPSAEMDVRCFICDGSDPACRTCKGTGWIEWGGCGMVNQNVLRATGVDPEEYQGFAFGMGVERSLMIRHGVADMREMIEGDVRFAAQFGMEI